MYVPYDDFNDNSFDTSKWSHYKVSDVELYERNQRLEFVWTGGTGGAVDKVTSTKVFELKADKEYEISVTVVSCGMGAGLWAFVNEGNAYNIGISPEGELSVVAVVDGNAYPLKGMVIGKTSGRLAIGVANSEVYFMFEGNEVYRETYRLPSRSVNIMLVGMVSNTSPLAAFDDAGYSTAEMFPSQIFETIISMFISMLPLFMMLMMFTAIIRTLKE
jgi:hypothetical protein